MWVGEVYMCSVGKKETQRKGLRSLMNHRLSPKHADPCIWSIYWSTFRQKKTESLTNLHFLMTFYVIKPLMKKA